MKVLYLDCFSGISGDMTIGALLDAGGDFEHLQNELQKLGIEDEYELKLTKVNKNGITSSKFDVVLKEEVHAGHHHEHNGHAHSHSDHEHHHHDHSHSHGDDHEGHHHEQLHSHDGEHEQAHHHGEHHGHHHHDHFHRAYKDIVEMIQEAGFSERVEKMALGIFKKIGLAEGKIHGMPLDDVHFHEVGAVDSIIDIVGTAILIDQLEIDTVVSSSIPTGTGKIHIDHGIYPVPAPATMEILKGIPIAKSELKAELTTPTGAAIAAVLASEFSTLPEMTITSVGYGAGTKTFPQHPNVLRVVIGEATD